MINYRYWVAPGSSNWNDTANWSNASGGSGGYSLPHPETVVTFDSSGAGSCTLDTYVSVFGLTVNDYAGTISQNGEGIEIGANAYFSGGSFLGDGTDIKIQGDLYVGDACQFTSTDSTLACDGTFLYNPTSGFFADNSGVVSLDSSGCALETPDATFSVLQFNALQTRVLEPCLVNYSVILKSGSARSTDSSAIVHMHGDLTCEPDYNIWNSSNDLQLQFDGSGYQNLEYHAGGVIPNITVDKTNLTPSCAKHPFQVRCNVDSPVVIKDYLNIQDGTFNTNGLDIQIGL